MRSALGAPVALAALLLAACASLPEGGTRQGQEISALWAPFFWAALGVAAVVYGLIIWSTIRYRGRDRSKPPQFRENLPLEVVYTLIPILIVGVLFVLTFRTEEDVGAIAEDPSAVVRVTAFDWSWRFDYEDTGVSVIGTPDAPPQMVLPAGRTVRIRLVSTDVIHSLYVPGFLFKRDAIPGHPTEFDLGDLEPGTYTGHCAEFCGLDHYRMRFTVRVVPMGEFEAWLEGEAR